MTTSDAYHRSGELGLLSPWATSLDGVHLYDSIVVLDKSARFAPFGEITGASEYLYFGRDPLLATNEMRAARDQSIDARAAMAASLDQLRAQQAEAVNDLTALRPALEAMTVEISQVKEALARTQDELAGSRALVDDMRTSTSWRATEPLRRSGRSSTGHDVTVLPGRHARPLVALAQSPSAIRLETGPDGGVTDFAGGPRVCVLAHWDQQGWVGRSTRALIDPIVATGIPDTAGQHG